MQTIPTNVEILKKVDTTAEQLSYAKDDPRINKQGEKLISKTESVIQDLRELIANKNAGDKVQRIIKESSRMYADLTRSNDRWYEMQQELNKLDTDELKRNLNNLQTNLRTLAIELLRSQDFRRDVYDLFSLLYILFFPDYKWEGAERKATEGRPSATAARAGERSAEGERYGEQRAARKEEGFGVERKEKFYEEKGGEEERFEERSKQETTTTSAGYGEPARDLGSRWERDAAGNWRLSNETNALQRFNNFESKEQVVAQFDRILAKIGAKPQTQDAFRAVLEIFYLIRNVLKQDTASSSSEARKEVKLNPHFQNILTLFQDLLFSMTNYDAARLNRLLSKFYYAITDDADISRLVTDFSEYIKLQLQHPDRVGSAQARGQLEELYARGRKLGAASAPLRKYYYQLQEELFRFFNTVQADALLVDTKDDIKDLVAMLVLDQDGRFVVKPDMLNQLKLILFVTLIQNLRFPLPEIVVDRGDALKARLRGVVLAVQDVLPERVTARNEGDVVLNLKEMQATDTPLQVDKAKARIELKLENMNFKVPAADIDFSRAKFPAVDDSGRVSITIGGAGIDLTIALFVDSNLSSDKVFEKDAVDCVIHDLDIKLCDTRHDTLYNAVIVLLKPMFKSTLQSYVEERIELILAQINNFFLEQKKTLQEGVQRGARKVLKELEKKV